MSTETGRKSKNAIRRNKDGRNWIPSGRSASVKTRRRNTAPARLSASPASPSLADENACAAMSSSEGRAVEWRN